jgi:hypothetical protein
MEEWNFRSWHTGLDVGGKNTNVITAESCLIAAGPARLSDVGDDFANKVFPLGLIENATGGQHKMLQQIREVGSRRSYVVSSYATGSITMSRVMYSQSSFLRVLTAANDDQDGLDNPAGVPQPGAFTGDTPTTTAEPVWFANLQAEIFDRPIGLLFYMLDQRNNPYGAMYAEDAMVQTHNFALAAQGIALSEQVSMMFDRLNPVVVSAG